MLLGPVFQAEMVTNARRVRYMVLRTLFAAALLLVLWVSYQSVAYTYESGGRLSIRGSATLAANFFQGFAGITLLAAMVVTPALAAGTIALERERRTIEYLFATDLSNAEIVLSKLAARLLLAVQMLAAALPVLAIFRLLGGIPGNLLIVYFAALASTVLLLTVGALCISVWTARARDAVVRVFVIEAAVFVLPLLVWPLVAWVSFSRGQVGWLVSLAQRLLEWLMAINPLVVLSGAAAPIATLGVGLDASGIWRMVYWHLGLTVVLATVAVTAVRRVHLRDVGSPGSGRAGARRRWQRSRPVLGNNPMLWKELFARSAAIKLGLLGRVALLLILLVTVGVPVVAYWLLVTSSTGYPRNLADQYLNVSIPLSVAVSVGCVGLVGLRAATLVTYEKERDCWLSLLSTPLTGAEILQAKAIGNLYAFRWALLPLVVVWGLQLTLSPSYLVAVPFSLLAIAATGLFATALGLAFSLWLSNSLKSIAATMAVLLFIGGGYLMCCCVPLVAGSPGGGEEVLKLAMIPCIPFLHSVPPMVWSMSSYDNDWGWMVADYLLGVGGYAVAGVLLLMNLVDEFDRHAGRAIGHASAGSRPAEVGPVPTDRPAPDRPAAEAGGEPGG